MGDTQRGLAQEERGLHQEQLIDVIDDVPVPLTLGYGQVPQFPKFLQTVHDYERISFISSIIFPNSEYE